MSERDMAPVWHSLGSNATGIYKINSKQERGKVDD
jgi:hypothetical protein